MKSVLGQSAVLSGFLACLFGAATIAVALYKRSDPLLRVARIYAYVLLGAAVTAVAVMEWALIGRDFSLQYVAQNGSRSTPMLYTVSTLWAALEGSILLW